MRLVLTQKKAWSQWRQRLSLRTSILKQIKKGLANADHSLIKSQCKSPISGLLKFKQIKKELAKADHSLIKSQCKSPIRRSFNNKKKGLTNADHSLIKSQCKSPISGLLKFKQIKKELANADHSLIKSQCKSPISRLLKFKQIKKGLASADPSYPIVNIKWILLSANYFLFFCKSVKARLSHLCCKIKKSGLRPDFIWCILWSRRDSNPRPNKELISFLQSLEHNWFSI
jgi:hypothetical protein